MRLLLLAEKTIWLRDKFVRTYYRPVGLLNKACKINASSAQKNNNAKKKRRLVYRLKSKFMSDVALIIVSRLR